MEDWLKWQHIGLSLNIVNTKNQTSTFTLCYSASSFTGDTASQIRETLQRIPECTTIHDYEHSYSNILTDTSRTLTKKKTNFL